MGPVEEFIKHYSDVEVERSQCAARAKVAMARLAIVMANKSGQSYKLRALIFSLWNGKGAPLNDVLGLDWQLRKDVCTVIMGFGHDDFFYDEIRSEVTLLGLWDWFIDESTIPA